MRLDQIRLDQMTESENPGITTEQQITARFKSNSISAGTEGTTVEDVGEEKTGSAGRLIC